ncbi:hypothetical protein Taro_037789 [Colocasia esculenta]|uniref:Uncharacterized protein n=1 Tax=Colocasia esculenta TaxID=4460 RepID=A0A843W1J9_COLES|nr:hypothetical protein [Colocasia esculenta]
MGLLDKLWDDTVAGPPPEAGLGRLRRHPTFSSSIRSALQQQQQEGELALRERKATLDEVDAVAVTRSITIVRTPSFRNTDSGSPSLPSSPASAPDSPFTPRTPRGGEWGKQRRKSSEAFEPRSPTVYDWVVISSLDR